MFSGDYGFLSSMGSPRYVYKSDVPRTDQYTDAHGKIIERYHRGVVFQFKPFQGGRIDEEMRFIPEHVPCSALAGANIQRPGHAAGYLDVTYESERTGVPEKDIIEYFLNAPHMKRKVGREYVLVDKQGNPVSDYGQKLETQTTPEEEKAWEEAAKMPTEVLEADIILKEGDNFHCLVCNKIGGWRGRMGHQRSKDHQKAKKAKVAA